MSSTQRSTTRQTSLIGCFLPSVAHCLAAVMSPQASSTVKATWQLDSPSSAAGMEGEAEGSSPVGDLPSSVGWSSHGGRSPGTILSVSTRRCLGAGCRSMALASQSRTGVRPMGRTPVRGDRSMDLLPTGRAWVCSASPIHVSSGNSYLVQLCHKMGQGCK